MLNIILLRHGQASFGTENYDRLSPQGHTQASCIGQHLSKNDISLDKVYCGTLLRHAQTWQGIAKELNKHGKPVPGLDIVQGFDEVDGEALARKHLPSLVLSNPELGEALLTAPEQPEALKKVFEFVINTWVAGNIPKPNIGSWGSFSKTVITTLMQVIENHVAGQTIGIVTSSGPVSAVRMHIDEQTKPELSPPALDWNLGNASLTSIRWDYETKKMDMLDYNNCTHLESSNLVTTL